MGSDRPRGVKKSEWDKLDSEQKKFLQEADEGNFGYVAENGQVCAMGAEKTGNLFSMAVDESEDPEGGSMYTLRNRPWII
jgi:hypothetical protein